jgi:hypothetical protein
MAPSELVTAQAGETNLVLRVGVGLTLNLVAIDRSSGQPCAAEYLLFGPAPTGGFRRGWFGPAPAGPREIQGLPQGAYDVTAITEDGQVGIARGLQARPSSEISLVEIAVRPGAALTVSYTGPSSYCEIRVFDDGTCVAGGVLRSATSTVELVPAGRLRVEARIGPDTVKEQWVETTPGGKHEASFRFE